MKNNRERMWFLPKAVVFCLAAVLAGFLPATHAATTTWNGGNGDWSDSTKWTPAVVPGPGTDVVITAGSVLLTNATANLASLTITGATAKLTFSNWNTSLTASNIVIQNGATVTHVTNTATATNALGEWPTHGRVYFVCGTNFELQAGGTIDAANRGYGGLDWDTGYGPGGGGGAANYYGYGGSYGGRGGTGIVGFAGAMYGLTNAPVGPGSGGGGHLAGSGGGAVRIDASNAAVTINGTISANGQNDPGGWAAGGSGGAIFITCRTFAGTINSVLTAKGGNGRASSGGGGGGRIAVIYDMDAQKGQPKPGVQFNLAGGTVSYQNGMNGTLYLPDSTLLTTNLSNFGNVRIYGVTNCPLDSLTVSNQSIVFSERRVALTVTNNLTINTSTLKLGSDISTAEYAEYMQLSCGWLQLTNTSALYVYSGATNATTTNYGARVTVSNDIVIASNCWIYPVSNGTNGGSVFFSAGNVTIAAGGGFNASGLGYYGGRGVGNYGYGPGGGLVYYSGYYGAGGGYGGYGGYGSQSASTRGGTYPWTNAPLRPGSGGGGNTGGDGGGLVWIEAAGTVALDGAIKANGISVAYFPWHGGGGSGGGIFIIANRFRGASSGLLSAYGGAGAITGPSDYGGGGGGGRIAVWHHVLPSDRQTILANPDAALINVPRIIITNNFTGTDFAGSCVTSNGWGNGGGATTGTVIRLTVPSPRGTFFTTH